MVFRSVLIYNSDSTTIQHQVIVLHGSITDGEVDVDVTDAVYHILSFVPGIQYERTISILFDVDACIGIVATQYIIDVLTRDGSYTRVELSQPGVLAYQQLAGIGGVAIALK